MNQEKNSIKLILLTSLFMIPIIFFIFIAFLIFNENHNNDIVDTKPLLYKYHYIDPNYKDKGIILEKNISDLNKNNQENGQLNSIYVTKDGQEYAYSNLSCTKPSPNTNPRILPHDFKIQKNKYSIGYYVYYNYNTGGRGSFDNPVYCYGIFKIMN